MRVGLNMLLWDTFVTAKHRRQLEALKVAGADGAEIAVMEGNVAHYRELGKILDDIGLARTCVAAILDPSNNPIGKSQKERRAALNHMRELIERAHALGADVVCGPMYQTLGQFSGKGPSETEKKHAADMLRTVADDAKQAGIILAIEPLNRFECHLLNTLEAADAFVKRVGHPSVGVLFDTFHANIEERDPVGCIRRHGRAIRHVHVSASDRGIPGRDHIDWADTFASLRSVGYDGWLVVEIFSRALAGVAAATRIWRDLFPSNERAASESIAFIRRTWKSV